MNELAKIRNENNLTQQQAASILGVSVRTYQRYEEHFDASNKKLNNLVMVLKTNAEITEDKGILTIDKIRAIVSPIMKQNNIEKCYLFGSYARNEARDNSDVDLLVETNISGLAFLSLIETLRTALHKRVDLIRVDDLKPGNELALNILKEGILL